MGSTPFRCQVRLTLSDLDRGVYGQRTIVSAQQPDEPDEHILLRFLAHVLCFDEQLRDAPGWESVHEPDLLATDLTGELTQWIECGTPPMKRLVRALGHHKEARFVALFADRAEAEAFRAELASHKPRNLERLELWLVPTEFLHWLESIGARSMVWSATLTEGTLYLDSDGHSGECVPERLPVVVPRGQAGRVV
jgi:uncharacterized protein YaeQ